MREYIMGLDIGGTKCAVILGSARAGGEDYRILDRMCFQTDAPRGPGPVIKQMISVIRSMLEEHSLMPQQISALGISCGGPLDHITGVIQNPPNLYGWDNIPIVKIMEEEFGIRTYIQNDANACALAEWKFGAARGYRDVIFLTCGTGMGAGLILDGRLYNGANNMAGEVGHVRLSKNGPVGFGKAGSFEGFCSGGGIAQLAKTKVLERLQAGERPAICQDLAGLDQLTAKSVADAARNGDPLAKEIYEISGYYLGKGLAMLIDILNPEIIVMGSVYERSQELLWPVVSRIVEQEALEISRKGCRIVPAKLGNQIGDYAALSVAIQGGSNERRKKNLSGIYSGLPADEETTGTGGA
ncbi:MAG TPA: ROK family protein [Candidatus Pullilachnospira intestinigallinarum]|nr:ROK family protein [Candidatus Pullilachnospira intestinigallinarum]